MRVGVRVGVRVGEVLFHKTIDGNTNDKRLNLIDGIPVASNGNVPFWRNGREHVSITAAEDNLAEQPQDLSSARERRR